MYLYSKQICNKIPSLNDHCISSLIKKKHEIFKRYLKGRRVKSDPREVSVAQRLPTMKVLLTSLMILLFREKHIVNNENPQHS